MNRVNSSLAIKVRRKKQSGAVLLIGLIMLFLITLAGVSSMQTVTLDEKVVSNMQSASLAFHAAETGLTNCETMIQQSGAISAKRLGELSDKWYDDAGEWDTNGVETTVNPNLPTNQVPLCVAEYIGDASGDIDVKQGYKSNSAVSRQLFRLTSYSTGGNNKSEAILESLFLCPGSCEENVN